MTIAAETYREQVARAEGMSYTPAEEATGLDKLAAALEGSGDARLDRERAEWDQANEGDRFE